MLSNNPDHHILHLKYAMSYFNRRRPVVFLILKIKLFYFEYQCFVKILQNQNTAHNKREKNVTQGEEKWAADRLIADCYPTFPLVQQC